MDCCLDRLERSTPGSATLAEQPAVRRPRDTTLCLVCGAALAARLEPDLFCCPRCDYWCSAFAADSRLEETAGALDERRRYAALDVLRRRNAQSILKALARIAPLAGTRLCDVGCGYGWFLAAAEQRGAACLGIEPDWPVAARAAGEGRVVRVGLFPDCLGAEERFDLLTFNDVLEHLPDLTGVIAACRRHLVEGGLLSVAIPSTDGILFRAAGLARRVGLRGPLDRLWQRHYPSPHRHYFNRRNLAQLFRQSGFELIHSRQLPTLDIAGLWSRLRMDRALPVWKAALAWAALAGTYPIWRRLPADILLQVYRRRS